MRFLVWQWGRRGGAPRFAAALAKALATLPDTEALLSLSDRAELLRVADPPRCELAVATYDGIAGFAARFFAIPFAVRSLARRIAALRPDVAICAMPGPLDLLMAAALRRLRVPFVVLVHDADHHPGDGLPFQMVLQRALCRRAAALGALSAHVATRLREQGVVREQGVAGAPVRPLLTASHPPFDIGLPPSTARTDEVLRLLCFGRLLPYKGLDLLAGALANLGPRADLIVRVVGSGPPGPELDALRALPRVTVENRWVPEDQIGAVIGWCDAVVLPYREASQSGVAAMALAAGRRVLATRVGGLAEQLAGVPGALLCEPDVAALTAGLRSLLASPHAVVTPPRDADAAWNAMAASLRQQIVALRL